MIASHPNWRVGSSILVLVWLLNLGLIASAQPGRGRGGGGDRPGGDRRFGDRGPGGQGDRGRGGDERRGPQPSSSSGSGSSTPSSSRPKSGDSTSVQGFGSTSTQKSRPLAPGFNVPLEVPGGNLQDRYDKRVIERADKETLPRYDRDKDGYLSQEEAKDAQLDPPFADSDLDKDGRLSRFELYERYAKKMNLPPKSAVVYTAATGGAAKQADPAAASAADHARVAEYAKGLLNQYDENKSGVLEKDEWKNMKADYHASDTNKDSVITIEELTVKLAGFGSSSTPSSSPPSGSAPPSSAGPGQQPRGRGGFGYGGPGGRPGEKNDKLDTRKSYRVPTATERLPKGLPDWFARNDTDADGQVVMAEYMTELTDAKAADFAKFDLNGDGIITPVECLEVEGKAKKK